jgi:hypothetical protein
MRILIPLSSEITISIVAAPDYTAGLGRGATVRYAYPDCGADSVILPVIGMAELPRIAEFVVFVIAFDRSC